MIIINLVLPGVVSHPARGAWIEIRKTWLIYGKIQRRTPQGVRGLKFFALILALIFLVAPRKGCVD